MAANHRPRVGCDSQRGRSCSMYPEVFFCGAALCQARARSLLFLFGIPLNPHSALRPLETHAFSSGPRAIYPEFPLEMSALERLDVAFAPSLFRIR